MCIWMYIATHAQAISHHLSADAQLTALQYKLSSSLQIPSTRCRMLWNTLQDVLSEPS